MFGLRLWETLFISICVLFIIVGNALTVYSQIEKTNKINELNEKFTKLKKAFDGFMQN